MRSSSPFLPLHSCYRLPPLFSLSFSLSLGVALLTYLTETRRGYGSHVPDRHVSDGDLQFETNPPNPRVAFLDGPVERCPAGAWLSSFNRCCEPALEDAILRATGCLSHLEGCVPRSCFSPNIIFRRILRYSMRNIFQRENSFQKELFNVQLFILTPCHSCC